MKKIIGISMICLWIFGATAYGAYHHMDEQDAPKFQQAYPHLVGTKLDDCSLCHSGGEYEKKPGNFVSVGSCQWCHMTYGYDGSGNVNDTLNQFGQDYLSAGRSVSALTAIESMDSDNDTYSNKTELDAIRFPGNADDDPTKVSAPSIVYTLQELEALEVHKQFMLMNTSRGGSDGNDFYCEYEGITLETLLDEAGMRSKAESITVFAPDGWSQTFDMEEGGDSYWIKGEYPQASFYYDADADQTNGGWVDYSAAGCEGRENGQIITNDQGLKCLLAYKRDGVYLDKGYLTTENKLEGEGPYRVVPPQKNPGPPDQLSTSENQNVIWPYDEDEDITDHNAGNSPRSATAFRVEPLPEGTTDFNWNEGGWTYVDNSQVLIYGYLRNGAIEGIVTDASGNPIAKAKVATTTGGYATLTDDNGTFALNGVVCGPDTATYTVTVSAGGYTSLSDSTTVSNNETSVLDFTLTEGSDNATCPIEIAGSGSVVALCRQFRDTVLAQSDAGPAYVKQYYRIAPELAAKTLFSSKLRTALSETLTALQPILVDLVNGRPAIASPSQLDQALACIDMLKNAASPGVAAVLTRIEQDLEDGTLMNMLSITIK